MIFEKIHEKTLLSLIANEKNLVMFDKNYLPQLEKIGENDIYVLTNRFVYHNMGSIYQKFLHFDNEGNLITDVKYNYTKLNTDGYLMKIKIVYPVTTTDFMIEYFIKLDDIQYTQDVSMGAGFQNNREDVNEKIAFKSIDYKSIIAEPVISSLLNSGKFFEEYLDYDIK